MGFGWYSTLTLIMRGNFPRMLRWSQYVHRRSVATLQTALLLLRLIQASVCHNHKGIQVYGKKTKLNSVFQVAEYHIYSLMIQSEAAAVRQTQAGLCTLSSLLCVESQ